MSAPLERRLMPRAPMHNRRAHLRVDAGAGRSRIRLVDMSVDGVRWTTGHAMDLTIGVTVTLTLRTRRLFGRRISLSAIVVRTDGDMVSARFAADADRRAVELVVGLHAETAVESSVDPNAAALQLIGLAVDTAPADRPRIVLVSSPTRGCGRSFITTGAARALAGVGRPVLVVDADFRNPVQHRAFGVSGAPGLAQALGGEAEALGDLVQHGTGAVHVLAAGRATVEPTLFSAERLRLFVERLRRLPYAVVLIDSGAVLTAPDALMLARVADSVLVVVRAGATRERDITRTIGALRQQAAHVGGIILNDCGRAPGVRLRQEPAMSTPDIAADAEVSTFAMMTHERQGIGTS